MAAVDRDPKPCLHPVANHVHGTRACYTLDGCRCAPCAAAVREYETHRTRQHAYNRWDNLADAGPAREHLTRLMDAGMGWKRVASVAGVSSSVITKLLYGNRQPDGTRVPSQRLRQETANKILAVKLERAAGALVPESEMNGLRLRLRALVALGWTQRELATRLGTSPSHFGQVLSGARAVLVSRAEAVRALYEELSMTPPSPTTPAETVAATRAKAYARKRGWRVPLELDDDYLDEPGYNPARSREEQPDEGGSEAGSSYDEVAVLRRLAGDRRVPISKPERLEIVRRACALGWTYKEIQRIAGVTKPDRYKEGSAA